MNIIITESQKNFLWVLRRLDDEEMISQMRDIVIEGFDYTDPCNFIDNYEGYLDDLLSGSAETFLNSYEDTFENKEGRDVLVGIIFNRMKYIFGNRIKIHYYNLLDDGCDEIYYN